MSVALKSGIFLFCKTLVLKRLKFTGISVYGPENVELLQFLAATVFLALQNFLSKFYFVIPASFLQLLPCINIWLYFCHMDG